MCVSVCERESERDSMHVNLQVKPPTFYNGSQGLPFYVQSVIHFSNNFFFPPLYESEKSPVTTNSKKATRGIKGKQFVQCLGIIRYVCVFMLACRRLSQSITETC